jgi:serine/threonine protein kinase/WD40 repeat protein
MSSEPSSFPDDFQTIAVAKPVATPLPEVAVMGANPDSSVPFVFGKQIAKGGMGAILEGEDCKLGRTIAVKVMLDPHASSEQARRFVQEAAVLGRLEHPNIVPIHDLGRDSEGALYYTMKLVKGRTLQDILNDLRKEKKEALEHYTLDRLLTIFRKVCDALAFAHASNIIHRDLKPENVMVGEFGEVLVMDWGIAKIMGELGTEVVSNDSSARPPVPSGTGSFTATMDGAVMGTPNYMSPEQAMGKVNELDERSDIFSLGGILYSILTLRPPVEGKDVWEVLEKVQAANITAPTVFGATTTGKGTAKAKGNVLEAKKITPLPHMPGGRVPNALSAVAMKALTLDKTKRYQHVAAFSADIEKYQGGFATSAENAGLMKQLTLLIQRNKGIFTTAAAAWLLITGLAVWFIFNLRAKEQRATRAEVIAVQEKEAARASFAQAQTALADGAFRSGDYPGMVQALEACPKDLRDQSWEYLSAKRDASLGSFRILGFENPASVKAVPNQPGQFALATAGGDIGLVDATTRNLLRAVKTGRTGLREVTFSGDGQTFVVRAGGTEVDLHDTASGTRRKTITMPAGPVQKCVLGHDASLLAVISGGIIDGRPSAQLTLIETATGNTRWLQRASSYGSVTILPDGNRVIASSGGASRFCWVLDAADGREIARHVVYAMCQALHPGGKTIAIGTQQGEVMLVSTTTGAVLQQGKLHPGRLQSMAWTADGHLLTMGEEGKIGAGLWLFRLWDPEFLAPRATFAGLKPGNPSSWDFNLTSGHLITQEHPPRLWRIPAGRELVRIAQTSEQAWGGAFLSDTVLLARKGYELVRYDLAKPGHAIEMVGGPRPGGTCCATHPATGMFATGPKIGTAPAVGKLFASEGSAIVEKRSLTLPIHVEDLAFDATAERLAVTLKNGSLEVFSVKTGESQLKTTGRFVRAEFAGAAGHLVALAPHNIRANAVEFHLHQLDGTSGKVLATATNRFHVQAFEVSPDRKLIALGGSDRSVHLFDAETLRETTGFRAHDGDVGALTFHPTQRILATASADGSVRLWDYGTGKLLDYYLGLAGNPIVLSFSPNGKLLMVDGQERTTRIYQVGNLDAVTTQTVGAQITARAVREDPKAKIDADGWTDLLSALTPEVVEETGNGWSMENGQLFSSPRGPATIPLPVYSTDTGYQLRLKLRQVEPREVFHLDLPVGSRMVGFDLDGAPFAGYTTGLVQVDGKWGKNLPGTVSGKRIKDDKFHDLEVTVRLNGLQTDITFSLDGMPLYRWTGPNQSLSGIPFWRSVPGRISVGSMTTDWVVSEVKVKRLEAGK